jgi:hypothetical protein
MKSFVLALTALASCAFAPVWANPPTAAAPKPCSYTDLMPAYLAFAARTAGLPPEERATAFRKDIAARYPDYYSAKDFGDDTKLQARAVRFFDPTKRNAVFPSLPPLTDAHLASMGAVIGPQFLAAQHRFIRTFTDFQCATTVEFGISLLKFDGHPAEFGGKQHLLFGVDVIATLHDKDDMPSFFDHEIFHLYHRQIIGPQMPQDDPAWLTLWVEGLATYVSQRMNPQLDAQHVLWFPRDIVARMQKEGPRAAKLLLQDLDATGQPADRWFLMGTQVEGLPDRAGYYLGYLFAKSVGDGVPLPTLTRKSLDQVHEQERAFLTGLAGP